MRDAVLNTPGTDPRLAHTAMIMIGSLSVSDPADYLRNLVGLDLRPTDSVAVLEQNAIRPACAVIKDPHAGTVFCLAGTQGALHVPQLVSGWLNNDGAVRGNGANPAFENAMTDILENLPQGAWSPQLPIRIFGYSYGGAVAQVLACELQNNLRIGGVDCVTFGSPRPGNERFRTNMSRVRHARYYCDNDPVRFIPPRVTEVPTLLYYQAISLWEGMNTQVQTLGGRQVEENGNIAITEGEPTRLHTVIPSILRWISDAEGFQSVFHGHANYLNRLAAAIRAEVVAQPVVDPPAPEREVRINIGNAAYWEEQARVDVVADPQATLSAGATVTLTRLDAALPLRYVRRKVNRIWVVKLGEEVVAVGPGKRRAGAIARAMNRAALAR